MHRGPNLLRPSGCFRSLSDAGGQPKEVARGENYYLARGDNDDVARC